MSLRTSVLQPRPTRCALRIRLAACLATLALAAAGAPPAQAGGTGPRGATSTTSTPLFMPQTSGSEVQFGDFISSNTATTAGTCATPGGVGCLQGNGLNTLYRYYIEVPAGLTRLRVSIFDADVGAGAGENQAANGDLQRDRTKHAAYSTNAKYTLINPSGMTVATQVCIAGAASAFCADDAWSTLFNTTTTPIAAGHWELDVDQSSAVETGTGTHDDINAFGIAADEGSGQPEGMQAATELPVYYSAQTQIGQSPTADGSFGTKTYTLYPYITSGCSFASNDFDYDLNNNGTFTGTTPQNVGSIRFTSPSAAPQSLFTKSLSNTSLSINDAWLTNSVTGWTTDNSSTDYGIWTMSAAISNYYTSGGNPPNTGGINGNYANVEIANSSAATCTEVAGGQGCAPANNSPTPNTFRVYLPTDSLGTPVKPFMMQEVTYAGGSSGPNPPVVGQTTTLQVTVQVVNPTAHAITFSAAHLVTVNVPGAGAVYAGSPDETQGTLVSQPAVGGTGNVTWNPGTVAAGATALLTYLVRVTPTSAGQRIPVVGTVASGNGTKGTWVDETGNTTQARATLTFGPLCELAVTQGLITPVVVTGVRARQGDRGGVVVEWDSSSEVGTVAFDLLRWDPREDRYVLVGESPVPALLTATQGGHYRVLDRTTGSRAAERYLLVEHVATPRRSDRVVYGPFDLDVAPADFDPDRPALPEQGFDRVPRPLLPPAPLAPERERALAAAAAQGGPAPSLAIRVHDTGIYVLPATRIAAALGLDPHLVQGLVASRQLRLTNAGAEIAWLPANAWAAEWSGILFYGQAPRSIFTTENVYRLSAAPGTWMSSRFASPAPPIPGGSFPFSAHAEQETFAATVVATDPDADYWYWASFVAGDPQLGSQAFPLSGEAASTIAQTAHLRLNVQGASDTGIAGEHQAQVSLNGTAIGGAQWTGVTAQTLDLPFDEALLRPGANSVQVTAVLGPGVPYSYWYLQSFDLAYQRLYQASQDALLLTAGANPSVTVSGFRGPRIHVFDLTDPTHPVWISGPAVTPAPGGGFEVSFVPGSPQTPYLAASGASWRLPDSVVAESPVPLLTPFLGADVLVIAPRALLPAAQELAHYRATQGFKAMAVDIQDIYDAVTGGLQDPHAIHDFLAYAHANWNPAPRYVVLAGTGTFDYKDNLGLGGNLVPPLMVATAYGLFASDNAFADVSGTGIPDTAIGRLPVATNAGLHDLVQKIEAYEAAPPDAWSSRAILVADSAQNFAGDSAVIQGALPPLRQAERIDLDAPPPAGARPTLLADLQSGVGLVNYVGHGGLNQLSASGLLLASDAAGLTNGPRQPVLTALTCTINRFEVPGILSLGAAFVAQPAGAAAAVWAASGLSISDAAKLLGQQFYLELGRGQGTSPQRLGDVIQRTLRDFAAAGGNPDVLRVYELLGDPALLVKPGVPPPAGSGGGSARE
jgi:Peptidase family C25